VERYRDRSARLSFPRVYSFPCRSLMSDFMNVFELTRALVDIESITGNEENVGLFLFDHLSRLTERYGGRIERMDVEPHRFNVFAQFGERPIVTLSTHMGIIASMITAAEKLLERGETNLGLLFVIGEERNSAGALRAAQNPRGSRFIINGEPTENKLALGSKGTLRYELVASGKMAHSAYPELGESAIEKLLDTLADVRKIKLPVDELLGPSTLNIGTISGGRAPNIIPDEAKAEVLIRLVGDSSSTKDAMRHAAHGRVAANEVLEIPALRLGLLVGMDTTVVAYTTDIPAFGTAWGQPFLFGPGSITVAHTLEERVPKRQLLDAVEIYQRMVQDLWKQE
jgi:acetylornithine deacetylase